MDCRRKTFI